jgi:iron(III) transport system permease protein
MLALLLLLVAYPLLVLVGASFGLGPLEESAGAYGFRYYLELFQHVHWLMNSLGVSVAATLLALLLAVVLAWILGRTALPGRQLLNTLIVVPYYMSPLVGALAWGMLGAPKSGFINRAFQALTGSQDYLINTYSVGGMICVLALFEMPSAYLMISAAMRGIDPSLEESSLVLGANQLTTALRVTLPLLRPAILGAALFVFSSMMGAFAVPAILGIPIRFYVATTAIYTLVSTYPPDYGLAAALGVLVALFTVLAVWLYGWALGSRSYAVIGARSYRQRLIAPGRWAPLLLAACWLYVLVGVALPLGALAFASIQRGNVTSLRVSDWTLSQYHFVLFEQEAALQSIKNSLLLGVLTGTGGVVLGGLVAWLVYRTRAAGRRVLEYLAMLPQGVPRLIFYLGLLWGWLVLAGKLYGTIWILLLAYLTVFLPLTVRSLTGVVVQLERSLEESARVVGASWLRTIRTITLPLLRPGVVAAWMLLFISSIRDVSASILLQSPKSRVLGPTIYDFWDSGGLPLVSALTVVQTVITLGALLVMGLVLRQKKEGA